MGKVTKNGPQKTSIAFIPVALGMIKQPQRIADWKLINDYKRMKTEKGSGRAIIAMTRKVSRIVFAMLQTREEFNPELMRSINKTQQTA